MKKLWNCKNKGWFIKMTLLFVMAGMVFFSISAGIDEKTPVWKAAPPNPEFVHWMQNWPIESAGGEWTIDGHPLGHIPAPVNVEYFWTDPEYDLIEADTLLAKYDLRTKNKLTEVRDQGSCGSCWAFATFSSLESVLMPKQKRDFSEEQLIEKHGLKGGDCDGGNLYFSMALLTRWDGPVNETDVPYEYLAPDGAPDVKKHIQNVIFIPPKNSDLNNNGLKNAVKKYGAVYVSMYYNGNCFNYATNAYYNSDSKTGGHAVAMVGWDDSYSRNNFNNIPPKNGAFIVRNSWGKNWGDGGYFYVSYYDSYFARRGFSMVFKKAEATSNYSHIYDYDYSGWVTTLGWGGEKAWMANIFTAEADEDLMAVSFYAPGITNNYVIYVYTGVSNNQPRSGVQAAKKSGKLKDPGYYTIKLRKKKVALTNGQKFSVVVKLTTEGTDYPLAIETRIKGYTKKKNTKSKKGQSFISSNGTSWGDIWTLWAANTNVCLKAFTK